MLFLLSSNFAWAVPWSEVTRFTGSGDYKTNYFICDHAEWRIDWNYKPNSTIPEIAVFNIYVYSRNEANLIGVITQYGNTTTSGTTYIHNRQGEFYLKFRVANLEGYTAIIQQDMGAVPEFSPIILLSLLTTGILVVMIISKKARTSSQSKSALA